jgi:ABC-2 type transport system ATP-binding protein
LQDEEGGDQAIRTHVTIIADKPGHGVTTFLRHGEVMNKPPPIIEATRLYKRFGKGDKAVVALDGLDLVAARGQVTAILGPNGAGKTTFVRAVATLHLPDEGSLLVDGIDVVADPQRVRQTIGLAGQNAAVEAALTGRENLVMVARLRRVPEPARVADDLLRRFGLTDAGGRRTATYSGGMRRRLDIAMSLIGDPPVIFLDEPTTGLDPEARLEVWREIRGLADGGTTVLLTTQYLEEAEKLADRIAILHQGTIIVSGTLAELRKLLPAAKAELVERQPTLEEIFLAIVGTKEGARS